MPDYFNERNSACPDWLVGNPDQLPRQNAKYQPRHTGIIQQDAEGKEVDRFPSAKAAAAALRNVTPKSIRGAAQNNRVYAGYRWAYITNDNGDESQTQAS